MQIHFFTKWHNLCNSYYDLTINTKWRVIMKILIAAVLATGLTVTLPSFSAEDTNVNKEIASVNHKNTEQVAHQIELMLSQEIKQSLQTMLTNRVSKKELMVTALAAIKTADNLVE